MHRAPLRALTLVNVAVFCVVLTVAFPLPVPRLRGAPLAVRPVPPLSGPDADVAGLVARLDDPAAAVRTAAAVEAGETRAREALAHLRLLATDADDGCARAAAAALERMGGGLGPLLDLALRRGDAEAVAALGTCDDPTALSALQLFLHGPDLHLRGAALRGLARRPYRPGDAHRGLLRSALTEALAHPDASLPDAARSAARDAQIALPEDVASMADGPSAPSRSPPQ